MKLKILFFCIILPCLFRVWEDGKHIRIFRPDFYITRKKETDIVVYLCKFIQQKWHFAKSIYSSVTKQNIAFEYIIALQLFILLGKLKQFFESKQNSEKN